jgi:hypothetical protein
LRRARAPGLVGITLAWAAIFGTVAPAQAQADKGLINQRIERVERSESQQAAEVKADVEVWTPAKIIINLDARCPVVTTLGYFGAFATADKDPAKTAELQSRYAKLQTAIQPIADELKTMAAGTPFVGQTFPATLEPRLNVLSGKLYDAVAKLYGDTALAELKQYVSSLSQGVIVGREKAA